MNADARFALFLVQLELQHVADTAKRAAEAMKRFNAATGLPLDRDFWHPRAAIGG